MKFTKFERVEKLMIMTEQKKVGDSFTQSGYILFDRCLLDHYELEGPDIVSIIVTISFTSIVTSAII